MASLPMHTFQSLFLASHCNVRNLAHVNGTVQSITDHLVASSNQGGGTGPLNFVWSSSNIIRSGPTSADHYIFSEMNEIPMYAVSNVCQPLSARLMSNAFFSVTRAEFGGDSQKLGELDRGVFQRYLNSFDSIFVDFAQRSSSNFDKRALSNAVFGVVHGDRDTARFEFFRSNDSAGRIRSNVLNLPRIAYHAYAPCYKLMEYNANLPTSAGSTLSWDQRIGNFARYVDDTQNLILLLQNNAPGYANDLGELKEAIDNATAIAKQGLSNYGMSSNLQFGLDNGSMTSNLDTTNDMLLSRREKLIVMTDYMIYQNQQVQHARTVMYAWIAAYVVVTTAFVFFIVADRRDVVTILASIILLSFAFAIVWKSIAYLRQINKK